MINRFVGLTKKINLSNKMILSKLLLVLTFIMISNTAFAINPCNCQGYSGPGGPCYNGPGGPAYSGPGGPAYAGPGGPCYSGPGGNMYAGPGGNMYSGPGETCMPVQAVLLIQVQEALATMALEGVGIVLMFAVTKNSL